MLRHAKWIWKDGLTGKNITCRFRRSFFLPEAPAAGVLFVSAHHFYKLWVNGTPVGGLASPAPSVFSQRKLVLRHDIAPLLQAGENVLAFTVLYLGGDGQNRNEGCPCLIFEAELQFRSGETRGIASDAGCRCSPRSAYVPGLPMREARGLTGASRFDPRREEPGWRLPGFSDARWEAAGLSPAAFLSRELSLQEIPEGAVSRVWEPACIRSDRGLRLYDAGEVLAGHVRVEFRGKPGSLLRLRYGELLMGERREPASREEKRPPSELRVEHSAANDGTETYWDEYVAQGGPEVWEEDFSYRAFRYVELTGCEDAEISSLQVCKAGTNAPCQGDFQCDDPAVNRLVAACVETQKNGLLGLLADCPHREQAEYLGDSLLQSRLLCYNFPDARALLRKTLRDFADSQTPAGYFPFVAPVDWNESRRFRLRMPEYDLLYAELLWNVWYLFDDLDSVREFYPCAAKAAAYYLSLRGENGWIPKLPPPCVHISDWPYSTVDEDGEALFVLNAYSLRGLERLGELAELLGDFDGRAFWRQQRDAARAAMRAGFFDREKGLFRDTPASARFHPGVNALAWEAGLFEPEEKSGAMRCLKGSPFESRVVLSWYYLRVLFENGEGQTAYRLLTDPASRWGRMIARGSRTIWEGFEDIESHSHAWSCYPLRLLQEYVLGVRCAAPGFRRVELAPFFPDGLRELAGRVVTPRGLLLLRGEKTKEAARFRITLPRTVAADFRFGGRRCALAPGANELEIPLPRGD